MGDKGEGRGPQKMGNVIYGQPLYLILLFHQPNHWIPRQSDVVAEELHLYLNEDYIILLLLFFLFAKLKI